MHNTGKTTNYMNQLRLIILDNYCDGKVLEKPIGRYIRKEMDAYRLKLVKEITDILMNTDYISKESKILLSVPYINYQGVVDELYIQEGKITNKNNVQSKVWYDKEKIVRDLGSNMTLDILEYTNRSVAEYMDRVIKLRMKLKKTDILDNVVLELPKETVYCDDISDQDFEEFLCVIAPYTKKSITNVEDNIDKNVLGYIRYLVTMELRSDTDIKRYEHLKMLLE